MATGNVQLHCGAALRGVQHKAPGTVFPCHIRGKNLCTIGGVAKKQAGAACCQFSPQRRVFIACGEDSHAILGQKAQHRAVFTRHGFHRVHELLVLTLGVIDQCHRGLANGCQLGDFAGMVHAHLQHGNAVLARHAQQIQRHADGIVEVATRGQRCVPRPAHMRAQNGGNHLCDGGLAVAAGHGNQRQIKLCAPCACQCAQRQQGVGHFNAGQTRLRQTMTGQRCYSTRAFSLRQKIMGVKTLALQGYEQIPVLQRARIGVHARQHSVAVADQAGLGDMRLDQLQRFCQGHHDRIFPSRTVSAFCASAISENGWRTPFVSW